jgi:Carboxypeptidase regulatory-like domain/TonB dependent receptor/TonB-dependent Receptor Plug Domain
MLRRLVLLLLSSLVLASVPAFAQQGTADLRGRVTDQQGAVLPGVTITVRHQESGLFRETVSSADGTFLMSGMTPGMYEVTAELASFKKYTQRDVRLEVGRATPVELKLEVGGLTEAVTVSAEAPLVDTTSQEIGGRISSQEFVDTPSFNRNFAGYLGMLPGVVATISATTFGADSISVAGQNVRNVNYTMDGSNNNDTFNGGNGGAQARVPVESVQEFQLLSSQFDAEYGLTSGGVVNAVSKSGTNQLHGAGFVFFQDQKLSSLEYFAKKEGLEEAPSKQQQYGGVLGGPIIRDKAHFFGSVERILLDSSVTTNIPTRPDLNRADVEISRVWNTYLRADHQLNTANTWGLRWLRETSPQPLQIQATNHTPPRHEAETDVDWTVVGNLTSVIGSTKVNTFRVSAVSEDVFFGNPLFNEGQPQESLAPRLDYLSFQDQQSARANRRLDVAYGADNVFAWFIPGRRGDHDVKVGINYLYSSLRIQDFGTQNGIFTMNVDVPFDRNNPRTYPERLNVRVGAVDFLMKGHFIGMFAQDRWKLNNNFTLNLGARYDIEILPTPNQENPLFEGDPDGYPMDLNNISPRVGFAWSLDEQGRSAVRGGAGVFYQRTSYTFLTNMFSNGRNSDSFVVNYPTNTFDPGPRQGNLPTNPMLSNGPTVNRALLDAQFPPGTRVRNGGAVRFDNPDRINMYSRTYSIGYERQVSSTMGVSVDFIRSEQRNQYVLMDLNPTLRLGTLATNQSVRVNPLVGTVGEWAAAVQTIEPVGSIDYNSLQFSGTKRYSNGWQARISYAYSRGRGNVPAGQADTPDSQFLGDLRLDNEYGPTTVDRPHILTLTGSYDVPRTGGLKLSGVFRARSGTPISLRNTTFDHDSNGSTQNEYLAPGTYTGAGPDASSPNAIPYTVEYNGGRAGARGPGFAQVDLRAGYRLQLGGRRTLDLFLDVFNLGNRANFANPSVDQRLPATFLRLLDVSDEGPTRTAQINIRYGF